MKLKNNTTQVEVILPDDLLWEDEFNWVEVESTASRTLSGELILDFRQKVAGRTITLVPPDSEMGWIKRSTLEILKQWSAIKGLEMTLTLEYPNDVRSFLVMFRHYDTAIEAKPVLGFPSHDEENWFNVTSRFIEVV